MLQAKVTTSNTIQVI